MRGKRQQCLYRSWESFRIIEVSKTAIAATGRRFIVTVHRLNSFAGPLCASGLILLFTGLQFTANRPPSPASLPDSTKDRNAIQPSAAAGRSPDDSFYDPPFDKRIVVTMETNGSIWGYDSPINVSLSMRNTSTEVISVKTGAMFRLSIRAGTEIERGQGTYWCPVDFLSNCPLEPNRSVLLVLQPQEERSFRFHLTDLKWGRLIQSQWPVGELFATVPKGKYDLDFVLVNHSEQEATESSRASDDGPVLSNRIPVIIQ